MYSYSVWEWLLYFFIYCFIGWCFESCYVSLKTKHWVNRGFMNGPFLPLYGSGAIMMLVVSAPFQHHVVATYFAGVVGATILEYITGVTMEALFKVRYWDYSNQKFNFQGQICLSSSLAWGFLTILMTRVVHKEVESAVGLLPQTALLVVVIVILVFTIIDFAVSFKAAIDLRIILDKMEKAKLELSHLQKRLDVLIAFTSEAGEQRIENFEQKLEDKITQLKESAEYSKNAGSQKLDAIQHGIEERFAGIKKNLTTMPEAARRMLDALEQEYAERERLRPKRGSLRQYFSRRMLRGNPGMVSKRFKGSIEELKALAARRKK